MSFYTFILKPILDKSLALILITILLPIFVITYLYVYFAISKKVIFSQYRPGLDQKLFKLYKFKTMSDDTDKAGALLQDDLRLNTYGQFLRKSSLDELPELFNILLGQMSFIGPRPLLEEYLNLYSDEQQRRHSVKPGLTGLAQVNGRNKLSWGEKLKLDTEYAKNLSFSMDIIIFFKTIVQIFKSDEVDHNGKIMSKFKGSSEK